MVLCSIDSLGFFDGFAARRSCDHGLFTLTIYTFFIRGLVVFTNENSSSHIGSFLACLALRIFIFAEHLFSVDYGVVPKVFNLSCSLKAGLNAIVNQKAFV